MRRADQIIEVSFKVLIGGAIFGALFGARAGAALACRPVPLSPRERAGVRGCISMISGG